MLFRKFMRTLKTLWSDSEVTVNITIDVQLAMACVYSWLLNADLEIDRVTAEAKRDHY